MLVSTPRILLRVRLSYLDRGKDYSHSTVASAADPQPSRDFYANSCSGRHVCNGTVPTCLGRPWHASPGSGLQQSTAFLDRWRAESTAPATCSFSLEALVSHSFSASDPVVRSA